MVSQSVEETAKLLRKLGIGDITDEIVRQVEGGLSNMPKEVRASMNAAAMLLSAAGGGKFDFDEGSWEPSASTVYSFDMEVFDVENMYTNFLRGIQAISGGEFEITDIQEDNGRVNWNLGAGQKQVSFRYNGNSCCFKPKVHNDWFDMRMLDYMNDVLTREQNPKRFFFMSDGYQGIIIFYGTSDWAEQFSKASGIRLSAAVRDR